MDKVNEFFRTRTVGFWIFSVAALIAFVEAFVYIGTYTSSSMLRYFSAAAFALQLVAVVASVVMYCFKPTAKWSALVLFGMEVCVFCLFISATYMYLSSILFGGFSASKLKSLNAGFVVSTLFTLISMILSIVAIFLKPYRETNNVPVAEPVEPVETTESAVEEI